MHDWKELVRDRLSPLPLEPGRREEIIEELAQQLEDAYNEQLAGGAGDSVALQRSLAQFQDWEGLRKDVFHAVKAAELPVWQQSGIFSPRRPWVWTALALSLALFALFGFRQALATLSIALSEVRGVIARSPRARSITSSAMRSSTHDLPRSGLRCAAPSRPQHRRRRC